MFTNNNTRIMFCQKLFGSKALSCEKRIIKNNTVTVESTEEFNVDTKSFALKIRASFNFVLFVTLVGFF